MKLSILMLALGIGWLTFAIITIYLFPDDVKGQVYLTQSLVAFVLAEVLHLEEKLEK